ncbi:MAG: hypothetical protein HY518_02725 [Candidatus Aenigmarchaeota archaeon]|nr:hypothetical protein [Candidatus Aenigmarchaeota archaeon]
MHEGDGIPDVCELIDYIACLHLSDPHTLAEQAGEIVAYVTGWVESYLDAQGSDNILREYYKPDLEDVRSAHEQADYARLARALDMLKNALAID